MTKTAGTRQPMPAQTAGQGNRWDHSTHDEFFDYYAEASQSQETLARFRRQRDAILGIPGIGGKAEQLDVADIGCGAGTLTLLWSELDHRVVGVDINQPLIELARKRAEEQGLSVRFEVGSATDLPLPSESFDLCFAPELLEHVADWETCLNEFTRILRPGGALFVSTSNLLCPRQQEFNLPLYSWYPAPLKRHYEQLAVTTRPELANYAKYPAVNWFTFYGLRRALRKRGFPLVMDRFDIAATKDLAGPKKLVLAAIRSLPPLRWLSHAATEGTVVLGIKSSPRGAGAGP